MRRKRIVKLSVSSAFIVSMAVLLSGFACNQAKTAAVAVNKYGTALQGIQAAEIHRHDAGTIDNETHIKFQQALKVAAETGQDLDKAIAAAETGGQPGAYVDAATAAFNQIMALIQFKDADTQKELSALAQAADDILKNAISLIQTIKGKTVASVPIHHPNSNPLALWLMALGVFPMMAAAGGVAGAISILNAVLDLEPFAVDLVIKLAQSLKGQTADQVLAMNEQIFGSVESTADAEIKKAGG
jgi:hypothetical protein